MAMALCTSMGALSLGASSSSTSLVRLSASSSGSSPSSSARCGLTSSFMAGRTVSSFSSSSFTGVALGPCTSFGLPVAQRCFLLKVRAGRPCLGCTKRSRSRKSRARVSGFRARLQTPTGRRVLKRRRVKGRKILVPAANPNSGKLA
ncbi:unnamed protein product [Sphagnum troendelagicum]|uniref:50S ribosomal protein L34, chloroplastic n=1 Tax=Sphagnum troendelagicum TaxID=128251 RepID=A0ABP0UCH4_9BRYO